MTKDANKIISIRRSAAFNTRVFYCIKCDNMNDYYKGSQLINIFDLDHDGILRVGFPCNPYLTNMYFNKEKMEKAQEVERTITGYYHAFNKFNDAQKSIPNGNIIRVEINKDTQIIRSYRMVVESVKEEQAVKVKTK